MAQKVARNRTVVLTARLPLQLGARVQQVAEKRGTSVSSLLTELVAERFPDPIPAASAAPAGTTERTPT